MHTIDHRGTTIRVSTARTDSERDFVSLSFSQTSSQIVRLARSSLPQTAPGTPPPAREYTTYDSKLVVSLRRAEIAQRLGLTETASNREIAESLAQSIGRRRTLLRSGKVNDPLAALLTGSVITTKRNVSIALKHAESFKFRKTDPSVERYLERARRAAARRAKVQPIQPQNIQSEDPSKTSSPPSQEPPQPKKASGQTLTNDSRPLEQSDQSAIQAPSLLSSVRNKIRRFSLLGRTLLTLVPWSVHAPDSGETSFSGRPLTPPTPPAQVQRVTAPSSLNNSESSTPVLFAASTSTPRSPEIKAFIPPIISQLMTNRSISGFERLFLNSALEQFKQNEQSGDDSYVIGAYHQGCFDEFHFIERNTHTLAEANFVNKELADLTKESYHQIWLDKVKREGYISSKINEFRDKLKATSVPLTPKIEPHRTNQSLQEARTLSFTPNKIEIPTATPHAEIRTNTSPSTTLRQSSSRGKKSIWDIKREEAQRFIDNHNTDPSQKTYLVLIAPPKNRAHLHAPLELKRDDYTPSQIAAIRDSLMNGEEEWREGLLHDPEALARYLQSARSTSLPPNSNSPISKDEIIELSPTSAKQPTIGASELHEGRILFENHKHRQGISSAVNLTQPHQEFISHLGVTLNHSKESDLTTKLRLDYDGTVKNTALRLSGEAQEENFSLRGETLWISESSGFGVESTFGLAKPAHPPEESHSAEEMPSETHDHERSLKSLFALGVAYYRNQTTLAFGPSLYNEAPGGYLEGGYSWDRGRKHISLGGSKTTKYEHAFASFVGTTAQSETELRWDLEDRSHRVSGEFTHQVGALSLKISSGYRTSDTHEEAFTGRLESHSIVEERAGGYFSLSPWVRCSRSWTITTKYERNTAGDSGYRVGAIYSLPSKRLSLAGECGQDYEAGHKGDLAAKISFAIKF